MQNISLLSEREERLLALDDDRETVRVTRKPLAHDAMEDKVRRAEEQLLALQQKRERLEQQKQELEELSSKQRAFAQGKASLIEQLTKSLPDLEAEADEARRRSDLLFQTRDVFGQHLQVLQTLNPETWDERNLKVEVERGLEALQEARGEIENFEQRIAGFGEESRFSQVSARKRFDQGEFWRWMKLGLAFSLPAMVFLAGAIWVVVAILNRQPAL